MLHLRPLGFSEVMDNQGSSLSSSVSMTMESLAADTEHITGGGFSNGFGTREQGFLLANLPETEAEYLGTGLSNGYLRTPQANLPETAAEGFLSTATGN